MKPIPSTAEILLFKMLERPVCKKWIDWAYDMLVAGFETENLVMLAGETEPYNQFEVQSLADKVLNELNLTWDDREQVYKNYVCYLVSAVLDGKLKAVNVLCIIKDVYLDNDLEPYHQDFSLLYWAYNDLTYSDQQWYWDGATRENIETIIKDYFMEWKAKCE
ncbi:hypothetical protein [Mucilaginibacter sp. OK098]|uniref:hypothetical protein n=1 Tax=Mucilaginibacter sp. OK098 TaxID=1855297 RepID=UPI000923FA2D|nr:hypothetical protein [Mucilaginibacter sp. OK098]SHM89934.1 hypothetical protein SAMN05216524_10423 [Mucilaginibacter sp. OK098]